MNRTETVFPQCRLVAFMFPFSLITFALSHSQDGLGETDEMLVCACALRSTTRYKPAVFIRFLLILSLYYIQQDFSINKQIMARGRSLFLKEK